MSLEQLAADWRTQAAGYDRDGLGAAATMLRRVAGELEAALRAQAAEELSLAEAAAEAGVAYSTMQRKVAAGVVRNVGTKHRPRVRRADLRRGPGGGPDLAGAVLRGA